MQLRSLPSLLNATRRGAEIASRVRRFDVRTAEALAQDPDASTHDHTETVNEYYDLCNELMNFGWGESLHFAPLSPTESTENSKTRHQRRMIAKLELREGMSVIDVGCGIGGPMRRVVSEVGCRVTGINISEVQLNKARSLSAEAGIDHMIDYLECSYMDMGAIADDTFDRGYAIESTCHAPDKLGAFTEICRVLKPGALLWGQEMCLTDIFDPENHQHRRIKQDLMHGIALKEIATMAEVNETLEAAGFEVVEGTDWATEAEGPSKPWYEPVETTRKRLGKAWIATSGLAEVLRVFPKGTTDIGRLMDGTAKAYVAGGKTGIFTPLYCFLARKRQ